MGKTPMENGKVIEDTYQMAKQQYAELGVDTDEVLRKLNSIRISLHCWQADDVGGFESPDAELTGGGIQSTGNFPGKATSIAELRQDLEKAMSLVPGKHRLNLHASYGDFNGDSIDRDEIEPRHFQSWIDWAKSLGIGLDFNPTCFSHPLAESGFTLSSKNEKIRRFWIEHVKRTRAIAAEMGRQLGTPCVNNIWIPDGSKDLPVDRYSHRAILRDSLDEIFSERYPAEYLIDSLEGKLFGLGVESMTVGSHEFYFGYAVKHNKMVCIDTGHYHPTEQPGDKISSMLMYLDGLMLHISRGVHWDSDHVPLFNEDTQLIANEIVRSNALDRVHIGLDFFDASINRIGAYVVGARSVQLALLFALLEPTKKLRELEESGMFFERLALLEALKSKPFGSVYDFYCLQNNCPIGEHYIQDVQQYEIGFLRGRRSNFGHD